MKKSLAVLLALALAATLALPAAAKAPTKEQRDAYAAQVRVHPGAARGSVTPNRRLLELPVMEFLGRKVNLLNPVEVLAALSRMKSMDDFTHLLLLYWELLLTDLTGGIMQLVPAAPELPRYDDYVAGYDPAGFMPGMEAFHTAPGPGWQLGFDQRSILPDDWQSKDYYLAGYMFQNWPANVVEEVIDDMLVRTVVLDDGRNKASFTILDTIGISGADVQAIREDLAAFAKENNIVSINVAGTHSHSGIDTIGLWAPLQSVLPRAVLHNLLPWIFPAPQSVDKAFMEKLRGAVAESVKAACGNQVSGALWHTSTDVSELLGDKRAPRLPLPNLERLRFHPANGGPDTYLLNLSVHPNTAGLKTDNSTGRELTADFPYYMAEVIEAAGANCFFINGAIAGVDMNRGPTAAERPDPQATHHRYEESIGYGRYLGKLALGMQGETKVEPILNIAHARAECLVEHPLILGLARSGLMPHTVLRDGRQFKTVTEIGYLELGRTFRAAIFPGELLPEMVIGGGAMTKEFSWDGTDFAYPSMREMVGGDITLFGLCNDMLGYILPDNDYAMVFVISERQNSNQELITFGRSIGSTLMGAFEALVKKVK